MKFLCGSCRTKYQISDEKVRGKILTIRCKKCGAKILVRESLMKEADGGTALAPVAETTAATSNFSNAAAASATATGASARTGGSASFAAAYDAGISEPSSESDDMPTSIAPIPVDAGLAGYEWYVAIDGQQHGPFAFAELVRKVQAADVVGRHYVWHDGMADWSRVRDVPDLVPYIPQTSGPRVVPPPPPVEEGSDADVLDFAARSKKDPAPLDPEPIASELNGEDATQSAQAALDAPQASASAPDHLASESSGGEPDGSGLPKTHKPGSESAVAAQGTVPEGVSNDLGIALDAEDIFANVPRASQQELVRQEATRFFVQAAGVPSEKKRSRVRWLVMALVAACLAAVGALWAMGYIRVTTFDSRTFDSQGYEPFVIEGNEGQQDFTILLPKASKRPNKKGAVRRRKPRKPGEAQAPKAEEQAALPSLGGDYVDDGTSTGDDGTRGRPRDGAAGGSVSIDRPGRVAIDTSRHETVFKGETELEDVVPPDTDELTSSDIARVVSQRQASVRICHERSLKAQEGISGRVNLLIRIRPTGKVRTVQITSSQKGSVLGQCLVKTIKGWDFPSFQGAEDQEVEIPFVFAKAG